MDYKIAQEEQSGMIEEKEAKMSFDGQALTLPLAKASSLCFSKVFTTLSFCTEHSHVV